MQHVYFKRKVNMGRSQQCQKLKTVSNSHLCEHTWLDLQRLCRLVLRYYGYRVLHSHRERGTLVGWL